MNMALKDKERFLLGVTVRKHGRMRRCFAEPVCRDLHLQGIEYHLHASARQRFRFHLVGMISVAWHSDYLPF